MMKKILVVDDSEITVDIVKTILTDSHYDVLTANNGRDAFELAKTFHPDLILLDVRMPKMGGYEFMRALRAWQLMERQPMPAVIVVTAVENMKDIFRLEGARDYLVKPVEVTTLLEKVGEIFAAAA